MKTNFKVSLQTDFIGKGREMGNTQWPGWEICECVCAWQVYKWNKCF